MLSESVLSVRKELFPQNKTAVSDMPKVNIQKKVQPTDADMVQTSPVSYTHLTLPTN